MVSYAIQSERHNRAPSQIFMIGSKALLTINMRIRSCLVHPGVRDTRLVSEIDLSQLRYETAFW